MNYSMAETYTANKKLTVRAKPNAKAKSVGTKSKGAEFTVHESKNGWGRIRKKEDKWVNLSYCKLVSPVAVVPKENTDKGDQSGTRGGKYQASSPKWYGKNATTYRDIMKKHVRAFGAPPRYTAEVDPYYEAAKNTAYTGRTMMQTWFSHPAIFSLQPGKVDYLPGFSTKKKNQFYKKVKGLASGEVSSLMKSDHNKDLNGQLYAFKSAYKDYINVVNMLARVVANDMGIGNVSDLIWGGNTPLNKFDYGWFGSPSKSTGSNSIFAETKNALESVVRDEAYVNFFVSNGSVQVGESFQTGSGETYFEKMIGSDSDFSEAANNIAFLFNGALSEGANDDLDAILKEARTQSEFLGGLSTMAVNYLRGGRIVFPKMITSMSYEKNINVELTFSSLYGDKRSIFRYCYLPMLHLLPFAVPQQVSENMYTFPYLVRCCEPGNVTCDLGFMSNFEYTRGGNDNTQWTIDGFPTELTVRFTITPLYSNMMVTSSRNPFLFLSNTGLIEYLANLSGLDVKANNLKAKVEHAKMVLGNYVADTPTNFARGLVDNFLVQKARGLLKLGG